MDWKFFCSLSDTFVMTLSSYVSRCKAFFTQCAVITGSFPLWETKSSPYTRQPIHFPSSCICSCHPSLPLSASSLPPFSKILGKVPFSLFLSLSHSVCLSLSLHSCPDWKARAPPHCRNSLVCVRVTNCVCERICLSISNCTLSVESGLWESCH